MICINRTSEPNEVLHIYTAHVIHTQPVDVQVPDKPQNPQNTIVVPSVNPAAIAVKGRLKQSNTKWVRDVVNMHKQWVDITPRLTGQVG